MVHFSVIVEETWRPDRGIPVNLHGIFSITLGRQGILTDDWVDSVSRGNLVHCCHNLGRPCFEPSWNLGEQTEGKYNSINSVFSIICQV